jgi:cysteine desulfurase
VRTIYLDYNATTPLDPNVLLAMRPFLEERWGNPSSVHHVGRQARARLDEARDSVAAVFKCKPSEVVFTSGGTESNNLAIFGAARLLRQKGSHIITSSIEHHSVLHACDYLARKEGFEITRLPVSADGLIDVASLEEAIRPDTILVSLMAANNETGTIQPVADLGAICRQRGIVFHTDAVQWFGKQPFASIHQFNADLVSICGHKFHGPTGAGALFIRSPLQPDPIIVGGGHENDRRAGTENLPSVAGLSDAIRRFIEKPVFDSTLLTPLTERLIHLGNSIPGVHCRTFCLHRLSNTVTFTVAACDSISLMAGLDLEGICASSGSACSAGSLEPSHVMLAMWVDPSEANSVVRFSLGRDTTINDIVSVESALPLVINRIRNAQTRPHSL